MNKIKNRDERDDAPATIAIVDDDESVRVALKSLFRSIGFKAVDFPSAEDFLKADDLRGTGCLILDVRMTGIDGLELQRRLLAGACRIPIVFVAGGADEETRARALKQGAIDFLSKPFTDQELLDAVDVAFAVGEEKK
jgi:FixJ family two-component response regulator